MRTTPKIGANAEVNKRKLRMGKGGEVAKGGEKIMERVG